MFRYLACKVFGCTKRKQKEPVRGTISYASLRSSTSKLTPQQIRVISADLLASSPDAAQYMAEMITEFTEAEEMMEIGRMIERKGWERARRHSDG